MSTRSPIATGVLLATVAAVAFGVTTPVVAWAGRGLGPFTTAALLYGGAAAAALLLRVLSRPTGTRLRRNDMPRVLAVALVGGAIAPTLLAWGLQRAGATVGALLLNLEAVFTVLLARAFTSSYACQLAASHHQRPEAFLRAGRGAEPRRCDSHSRWLARRCCSWSSERSAPRLPSVAKPVAPGSATEFAARSAELRNCARSIPTDPSSA